jgi:hypothetical protein
MAWCITALSMVVTMPRVPRRQAKADDKPKTASRRVKRYRYKKPVTAAERKLSVSSGWKYPYRTPRGLSPEFLALEAFIDQKRKEGISPLEAAQIFQGPASIEHLIVRPRKD